MTAGDPLALFASGMAYMALLVWALNVSAWAINCRGRWKILHTINRARHFVHQRNKLGMDISEVV